MPPMYNALAAKAAATPGQAPKPTKPPAQTAVPGTNAKPNKDANAGQVPGMMGDKQKIARPPAPQIAGSAAARPTEQRSGIEMAMGAAADQLHPPKRR